MRGRRLRLHELAYGVLGLLCIENWIEDPFVYEKLKIYDCISVILRPVTPSEFEC
jgi:hypothetical protein